VSDSDVRGETFLGFFRIARPAVPSARAFRNDRRFTTPASSFVAAGELHGCAHGVPVIRAGLTRLTSLTA